MMLMPRRDNSLLFDTFFKDDDFLLNRKSNFMKTDIREKEDSYVIDVEMPGCEKENINLSLNDGYLEISAKMERESSDDNDKYLHQERFYGEGTRSFYVGDDVLVEDIEAEFKNGILKVVVPKREAKEELSVKKQIEIK